MNYRSSVIIFLCCNLPKPLIHRQSEQALMNREWRHNTLWRKAFDPADPAAQRLRGHKFSSRDPTQVGELFFIIFAETPGSNQ